MIVPTKRFADFLQTAEPQKALAELLDIDQGLLSRMLAHEQSVSAPTMERFARWCHWPLNEMFEIVDGDTTP